MIQRNEKQKAWCSMVDSAEFDTGDSLIFHEPICESMAICVLHSALI